MNLQNNHLHLYLHHFNPASSNLLLPVMSDIIKKGLKIELHLISSRKIFSKEDKVKESNSSS